uniref:Innexin n=2 Tax=Onchocerca TaxID=6281 RepID=A0A8R1TY75_ONCVO
MVVTAVLSMVRYIGDIDDWDFVDRLHSYFTVNILIAFSILVSFKQFSGKPVECLVPDIFSGSWEQYAENYCWAQDTYYIPIREVVAGIPTTEKKQRRISYYQWVPFFLLVEAACFRSPSLVWKYMAGHSGIKLHEIVKLSSDPNNIKPEIKKANIKSLTLHLHGTLRFHRRLRKKQIHPHRYLRLFNIPYTASFVTYTYVLTKLLYLVNACVQLLIMNRFLETDRYNWYGLGAALDLLNGTTWEQSGMFPRVSLCDFDVRVMGNIQEHTIQCVLVINIFNEKIFIFLWFWYLALIIFTTGSLIFWIAVCLVPYPNRNFIIRHLEMSEFPFDAQESEEDVERFINMYLKSDGMFVVRMIALNSGVMFGNELIFSLWKSYFGVEPPIRRSSSFPAGATIWSPPSDKQLNDLDLSQFDNDSNLKLLRSKIGEKKNDPNTMETILDATKSEKNPLLLTQKSTAPTETFRSISKRQVNNENRLTQRTALSSNLPSACSSPTEKTAKFMI